MRACPFRDHIVDGGADRARRADGGFAPSAEYALQRYWQPLYTFIRSKGHEAEAARDLTQAFFTLFLEKRFLDRIDRERGTFRAFLRAAAGHFLSNEWHRAQTQKRGSGAKPLPLDFEDAEARFALTESGQADPGLIFDRQWARTVLDNALARLEQGYADAGNAVLFAQLRGYLTDKKGGLPYPELSMALGMSEGAARVAVHRMRRRYGDLVRAEVAQTVADSEDLDEEIRYLIRIIS